MHTQDILEIPNIGGVGPSDPVAHDHALWSASSSLLASQIQGDLETVHSRPKERFRPILTHLNADTSWLLSVPVPKGEEWEGKRYLHILFDPWFRGSQEDVHGWFSKQWHASPSYYQTIKGVERLVYQIEGLQEDLEQLTPDETEGTVQTPEEGEDEWGEGLPIEETLERSPIDAIICSHEFTDHMHEATLKSANPTIPIFAPMGKAYDMLVSRNHFQTVMPIVQTPSPEVEPDWRNWQKELEEVEGLEWTKWLKITRLMASEKSMIGFHEGVLFTYPAIPPAPPTFTNFPLPYPNHETLEPDLECAMGEAIIYSPHGLPASAVQPVAENNNIKTLCLLHGEHDIRLAGAQLNLGEKNGKEIVKRTMSKYWVATHDEVKHGSGLVSWFLSRTAGRGKHSIGDGNLGDGRGKEKREGDMMDVMEEGTICRTVENGGKLVLK